jgi:hypothetical protein
MSGIQSKPSFAKSNNIGGIFNNSAGILDDEPQKRST